MKKQRGFSIIEILIAMALALIVMSGVVAGSGGFASTLGGYQSSISDSEINSEALRKAQDLIEEAVARARTDYSGVASSTEIDFSSGLSYLKTLAIPIAYATQCMEAVVGTVSWTGTHGRTLSVGATTTIVNIPEMFALGGDCDITLPDDWDAPNFYENAEIIHPGSQATDVDVISRSGRTYALLTSQGSGFTFWVVDVTDPENPAPIGQFDVGNDVYGIDAILDDNVAYAYLATASSTAQLQVIKIDFSLYPGTNPGITRAASKSLSGVSGSQATTAGRTVLYYDEKLYVGKREGGGNELHVFDASTPSSPTPLGSVELNHTVYDIEVRGDYAFIAASAQTDAGCELIVIDIRNPSSLTNTCLPSSVDGEMIFRAPGKFDGTSVAVVGERAYLGRQRAAASHDFFVLDISDLEAISSLGSLNMGINSNTQVVGLEVRGAFAFVATSDQNYSPAGSGKGGPFMVYNVADPQNIFLVSVCTRDFSEQSTGMDFFENATYVTNTASKALRILYPSPSCS